MSDTAPTDDEPIAYAVYGRATGNLKYVEVLDEDEVAERSEFYDVVPLSRLGAPAEPAATVATKQPFRQENRS